MGEKEITPPTLGTYLNLESLIESGDKERTLQFIEEHDICERTFRNLNGDCCSPLSVAVRSGKLEIATALFDLGLTFEHQYTPSLVDFAVNSGHLPVLELLASRGYHLDIPNSNNDTPLLVAAERGHWPVVRYLVESGSDINYINKNGETVLHKLIPDMNLDIIKSIFSKGFSKVNQQDAIGNTPLLKALMFTASSELVQCLIDEGSDVTVRNALRQTAFLAGVVFNDNVTILRALYRAGSDPESSRGLATPLLAAVRSRRKSSVPYLVIELNVRMDSISDITEDALAIALKDRQWDIATFLVRAGFVVKPFHLQVFLNTVHVDLSGSLNTDDLETVKTLFTLLSNPLSLFDLCTFTVRKRLGRNVMVSCKQLPLPSNLQNYIRLDHLSS